MKGTELTRKSNVGDLYLNGDRILEIVQINENELMLLDNTTRVLENIVSDYEYELIGNIEDLKVLL